MKRIVRLLATDFERWGLERIERIERGVRQYGVVFEYFVTDRACCPIGYASGFVPTEGWSEFGTLRMAEDVRYRAAAYGVGENGQIWADIHPKNFKKLNEKDVMDACRLAKFRLKRKKGALSS